MTGPKEEFGWMFAVSSTNRNVAIKIVGRPPLGYKTSFHLKPSNGVKKQRQDSDIAIANPASGMAAKLCSIWKCRKIPDAINWVLRNGVSLLEIFLQLIADRISPIYKLKTNYQVLTKLDSVSFSFLSSYCVSKGIDFL